MLTDELSGSEQASTSEHLVILYYFVYDLRTAPIVKFRFIVGVARKITPWTSPRSTLTTSLVSPLTLPLKRIGKPHIAQVRTETKHAGC
jgi:hypothetical protein